MAQITAETKLALIMSHIRKQHLDAVDRRSPEAATELARVLFFAETGKDSLFAPEEEFQDFEERLYDAATDELIARHEMAIDSTY